MHTVSNLWKDLISISSYLFATIKQFFFLPYETLIVFEPEPFFLKDLNHKFLRPPDPKPTTSTHRQFPNLSYVKSLLSFLGSNK